MEKIKTEYQRCLHLASYFASQAIDSVESLPEDMRHQERNFWYDNHQRLFHLLYPFVKPKKAVKKATGYSTKTSLVFTGGLIGDIKGEPKIDGTHNIEPVEENESPTGGMETLCDGGFTDGQAEPRGVESPGPGGSEGGSATESGGCGGGGAVE